MEEVYGQEREENQSRRQLLIPSHLQTEEKLLGQRELLPSEASESTPHRNVFVICPEERHSDQQAWESILLSIGETELVEVYGHERDQDRTRRQLLIPSPLQTN